MNEYKGAARYLSRFDEIYGDGIVIDVHLMGAPDRFVLAGDTQNSSPSVHASAIGRAPRSPASVTLGGTGAERGIKSAEWIASQR